LRTSFLADGVALIGQAHQVLLVQGNVRSDLGCNASDAKGRAVSDGFFRGPDGPTAFISDG